MQEEGQQLREARIRAVAKCEELQRRVSQVEEERDAVERKLNKEAGLWGSLFRIRLLGSLLRVRLMGSLLSPG